MYDILITIILSTVKFGMTFPLAISKFQFGFFETILWINLGGILGIYFFAYLSDGLNQWINMLIRKHRKKKNRVRPKKVFTRRNRRIIRIKQKYGLIGISLSTPIFFSIPIGVFLVVRYYSRIRSRFLYMIAANLIWSFLYTFFYTYLDGVIFRR